MQLTSIERTYLLALCSEDIFGSIAISTLFTQYHSFQKIFESDPMEWQGITEQLKTKWKNRKPSINPNEVLNQLNQHYTNFLTYYDSEYPQLLKEISSPPIILYYQGNLNAFNAISLGVVGTRMISSYGQQVVQNFIPPLATAGITITSGFQKGIDQAAHKATLENNGITIAVLGTGIDQEYPSHSKKLREELLAKNGLILSEYPLGTPAYNYNFPRRNRIISGLSKGVLVVEAALKSGSLITAKYALEQNRDVYAVPGSVFSSLSQGPHFLIKQGAKCITSPEDLLEEFTDTPATSENLLPSTLSEYQLKIYKRLQVHPYTLDELVDELKLPVDQLSSELTLLEIEGVIANMHDGTYIVKGWKSR